MMDHGIWVVIGTLPHDHGIQLVHHGQQEVELVARLGQVNEDKVAQQQLANLHQYDNRLDAHSTLHEPL